MKGEKGFVPLFLQGKVRTEHLWDREGSAYSSFAFLVQLMFAAFHPDTFRDENLPNQVYANAFH